jgi:hypothetical protein
MACPLLLLDLPIADRDIPANILPGAVSAGLIF